MPEDIQDNSGSTEVAPQDTGAQSEQVAPADSGAMTPDDSSAGQGDNGEQGQPELILGKFKTPEDLAAAYQNLEKKLSERPAPAREEPPQQAPAPQEQGSQAPSFKVDDLPFDEETLNGLETWFQRRYESQRHTENLATEGQKVEKFYQNHKEELDTDPILRGTIIQLFDEARANKTYLEHEEAYTRAKEMLDKRFAGKADQVRQEGFQEGQDLTKTKQQMGAIGNTSKSKPPVDEDKMSFEEYTKFHNLGYKD